MSIIKGCLIAAIALAAGAAVENVRADEAYVCEQGRVVYVKPGELAAKRLQEPCLAQYFDKIPSTRSSAASAAAAPAAVEPADGTAIPRPTLTSALQAVERAGRAAAQGAAGAKAVPAAPSDYRNVRIINAEPGSDGFFRHRR